VWITRKKEADSTLVEISLGMGDPDNTALDLTNTYKVK
jgi:hypothetical protein